VRSGCISWNVTWKNDGKSGTANKKEKYQMLTQSDTYYVLMSPENKFFCGYAYDKNFHPIPKLVNNYLSCGDIWIEREKERFDQIKLNYPPLKDFKIAKVKITIEINED
jgi:hypothetical protein